MSCLVVTGEGLHPSVDAAPRLEKLQQTTFREADGCATGNDDVLGGFPECQPHLHSCEGD
jgi:hypothetical protein